MCLAYQPTFSIWPAHPVIWQAPYQLSTVFFNVEIDGPEPAASPTEGRARFEQEFGPGRSRLDARHLPALKLTLHHVEHDDVPTACARAPGRSRHLTDRSVPRGWPFRSAMQYSSCPSDWSRRLDDPARCGPPPRALPDRAPGDRHRVDILVVCEAAEHRLAKKPGRQMAGVPATATFRQHRTRQISEAERIIHFSVGQDTGIRSDTPAMEFQLQVAVKTDQQAAVLQFNPLGVP